MMHTCSDDDEMEEEYERDDSLEEKEENLVALF
jgi:hypothetical protein